MTGPRRMPLLAVFAILATSTAAQAQETIDVAKIKCGQFLAGQVSDSRSVSIWLSGYYHGLHNNTLLDVNALQQNSQAVLDYCIVHSDMVLMDAVTAVLGKQN